jgi:uncharacterized protein YjbJ (UPF0337 family)
VEGPSHHLHPHAVFPRNANFATSSRALPPPAARRATQTVNSDGGNDMSLGDQATGTAKEAEGKLTGDRSREAEGKLERGKGEAKDALGHVKDAAGNLAERARERLDEQRGDDAPPAEDRR